MLFHIYVCLVIDCSFVILLFLMLFIMPGLSFASYMPYIVVRFNVPDVFFCDWSHKTRGIENYYCDHAPCVAMCSICCFLGHFHLAPSVILCMHSQSFPQLLQTCFLCFCFICLFLSVGYCFPCFLFHAGVFSFSLLFQLLRPSILCSLYEVLLLFPSSLNISSFLAP